MNFYKLIKHSAQGFTLLEVLIALVVFSIGLLGLASLQMTGLKLSHDSYLRSTANMLAMDIADRMRANPTEVAKGLSSAYNNSAAAKTGNPSCLGKDGSGGSVEANCAPEAMAQHDFYEWYGLLSGASATTWHPALRSQLPNGQGVVCIDSTPNDGTPAAPACDNVAPVADRDVFTIKIWWTERKDDQASTRRYTMSVAL